MHIYSKLLRKMFFDEKQVINFHIQFLFLFCSRLNAITLPSIGKFRSFTNETLTDILFFTSPMYCQVCCHFTSFSGWFISPCPETRAIARVLVHTLAESPAPVKNRRANITISRTIARTK